MTCPTCHGSGVVMGGTAEDLHLDATVCLECGEDLADGLCPACDALDDEPLEEPPGASTP